MEKITREELLKAKIPGEETGIQVKTGFCGFCGGDCLLDFYIKDGKNYYPLRNIIEAEGGQLVYNEKTKLADISVKGKSVIFDNEKNVFTADGFEIDGAGYRLDDRKYGYMTKANLYFSAELYKKVFGIDVEG